MHEPIESTVNEHGDEVHPAYGMISAHRVTSTPGATLFDSEIRHSQYMVIEVRPASRKRDLNHDWIHPESKALIEINMSEAQWASFVSSTNSSGTPCTVRRTETEINVPGLEPEGRLGLSTKETRQAAERAFEQIKAAVDALENLDPKAGIKARRQAMRNLRAAVDNAPRNVEWAAETLAKHTENVVQKARADVEAMVVNHARHIGLDPEAALQAITAPQVQTNQIEES